MEGRRWREKGATFTFSWIKNYTRSSKKKVLDQGYTVTGALERIFEKVINGEIVFDVRDIVKEGMEKGEKRKNE